MLKVPVTFVPVSARSSTSTKSAADSQVSNAACNPWSSAAVKVKFNSPFTGVRAPLVVKAADRLANVRESVRSSLLDPDNKHLPKYRAEHPEFRLSAHRPGLCDEIWAELDKLLS
mgnify:CR=1 FL=1